MKTNKNLAEKVALVAGCTSIIGILVLILCTAITLFFLKEESQILNIIGITGAAAFMLPFFISEFALPAGILDHYYELEIPAWGKAMFYLLAFPFANMWMLGAADAAFHFLPDYHQAMSQGKDALIVEEMWRQSVIQAWSIIGITYVSMIGAGLLFKKIFDKRLKVRIA